MSDYNSGVPVWEQHGIAESFSTKQHETKISDDGRGTYLKWQWVQHGNWGGWIVGHIQDRAGRYERPRLFKVYYNNNGKPYVHIEKRRQYLWKN